ncbi:MAG: glycosyltransferase family 2 protein [Chitinophagales bacterium]
MRILVCLPTYNEEINVKPMVNRIRALNFDLIVITDGLPSNSSDCKKWAKVLMRDKFGKGSAIIKCMEYAENNNYNKVITIDCDQTYHPEDIPRLIENANQYDMVVGVRPMKNISFLRRIANYFMNFVTNFLFCAKVKDMASGFRLIDVNKFKPFLTAQSFDIEPQIYAVGLRRFKILEVAISYDKRVGDGKINIPHLFLVIYRLMIERFK